MHIISCISDHANQIMKTINCPSGQHVCTLAAPKRHPNRPFPHPESLRNMFGMIAKCPSWCGLKFGNGQFGSHFGAVEIQTLKLEGLLTNLVGLPLLRQEAHRGASARVENDKGARKRGYLEPRLEIRNIAKYLVKSLGPKLSRNRIKLIFSFKTHLWVLGWPSTHRCASYMKTFEFDTTSAEFGTRRCFRTSLPFDIPR